MAVIEILDELTQDTITTRQRWSHYITVALGILAVVILINLRANIQGAASQYVNNAEGITAYYPQNWLLEESDGTDYIFRVSNLREIGFKTTFQVSVEPVNQLTTSRTIFDALSMQRAQNLTAFRRLSIEPYTGSADFEATTANYLYVATDTNPFQQSVPVVVRGIDILTLTRDQAVIITMLSNADTFEENLVLFEQFVNRLELR